MCSFIMGVMVGLRREKLEGIPRGSVPDGDVSIGMDFLADQPELAFKIASAVLKESASMVRGAPRTTSGAPYSGAAHGLLDGEAADRLHRHTHRLHDFTQLIERAGASPPAATIPLRSSYPI